MHISATLQEDGSILMNILKPEQDPPRRIIFFPPDEEGWSWQQEWWFENSQAWTPVYKIRATPWTDDAS